MVKRSQKLAFIKVIDGMNETYTRMTGFTELSISSNPKEYSRRYIDEEMERSSVVSYQPTISYKFDYDCNSEVHNIFLNVSEFEHVGEETLCSIAIVDLSREEDGGCMAAVRDFYIIPEHEGDDQDVYTFSGTLKAAGEKTFFSATSNDNWQTMTIKEI